MLRPTRWAWALVAMSACNPLTDTAGPPGLLARPDATAAVTAALPPLVRTYGTWQITMTDLGTLTPNGESSAYSINDLGEIVGTSIDGAGHMARPIWVNGVIADTLRGTAGTPYTWNNRRETVGRNVVNSKAACSVYWIPGVSSGQLPPLPGGRSCATYAFDVNASGEMAGGAESNTGVLQQRPVTWKNGVIFRDLGLPPGARSATGAGINDAGDVVGHMTNATTGKIDGFVFRNGTFTRLTPIGTNFATYAIDINNRGDIVGTSNGGVPVIWKAGSTTPTILPIPAGRYPHQLWHVNDNGDVIGSVSALPPAFYSAALWRNGQFIDLGVYTGGTESYARGINSAGTIVGVSTFSVGTYGLHAMAWTVVPRGTGGTNTPPSVTLTATSPTTIPGNGTVTMRATFTDPDAADGPWSYTWKWGNGPVTGTWPAPGTYVASRTYIKAGASYNVTVIVTDKRGAADTSNVVRVTVQ